MIKNVYKDKLKVKMDGFVHLVYELSRSFPKEEMYGITSQLRRASVSIILNYIEGFARTKRLAQLNFLEISYGSFKETKYLLYFCLVEKYFDRENYDKSMKLAEEIGAMLWTEISRLKRSL